MGVKQRIARLERVADSQERSAIFCIVRAGETREEALLRTTGRATIPEGVTAFIVHLSGGRRR